ncbi:glycosyltransferase family 9 protein [Elongatibacter sediminis]|uniref:Glycosyltransferase family 9 protein n=1 Tax=Elongatibacter sediminis TaxID=3119006 RepID=A0AAW9RKB5_9GAMM
MALFQKPPESLCILRLSALGDVTHVVPVIRCLQHAWPETRLTWIIGKLERRLLGNFSGVEFIEFDKRGGWPAVRKLNRQLSGRRFSALLHMQVAARANLLSRLVRSPLRLGWDRARSRDLHHWFTNRRVAPVAFQHQTLAFLEFARALGLEPGEPRWSLPISAEAENWAREHTGSGRPVIVISPCSSHTLRNWRPEFYAAAGDFAHQSWGARVILTGGPSPAEVRMAKAIANAMKAPSLNLVGKDTLEQSKALLQRADLVISPDAGPAHIASALGTPVLGLYAATWSRRSGPYRSLQLCVDRFREAARRFRGREPEELRWGTRIETEGVMDLIQPGDVIEQLRTWRAASESPPGGASDTSS